MATNVVSPQVSVNTTAGSAEPVAGDVVPSTNEDSKQTETPPVPQNEAVPASGHDVTSVAATQETREVKAESMPAVVASASTSANGEIKDVKKTAQDVPSTTTTTVAPLPKTEEVKIESVSTVVAGVVGDLKNVEVGLAKEAVPATGKSAPAPSLTRTLEGGLRIVEKEAEKGAQETVATIEQHPELIAEGALAAVVGVASLVQPELLPGAVAMVGKMASDSAKKTVTKIATDEGKKVATAIAKDVSADAAKEKAVEAAAAGTVEATKASTDGAKVQKPGAEGTADPKTTITDASKDTSKASEVPNGVFTDHLPENSAVEKSTEPEASKAVAVEELPKPGTHPFIGTETIPTATKEIKGEPVSGPKSTPLLEAREEVPSPGLEQPSASQQVSESAVIAAVSSVTTTAKTTINQPEVSPEKQLVTIPQASLDLLHKKIDAMHEAIKHITEILALHLPPTTMVADASKPLTGDAVQLGQTSEPELISAPAEPPAAATEATEEPIAQTDEQSPTKRPSLEKRSSVLGSMGKIFWPFGSTAPTKRVAEETGKATAKSDTPKVPTVTVSEVTPGSGIEI